MHTRLTKNLFGHQIRRPSLFTCSGSLIDLLVDLLVKLKMVVSGSILELEKNFKIHKDIILVRVCLLHLCSSMHDFVLN